MQRIIANALLGIAFWTFVFGFSSVMNASAGWRFDAACKEAVSKDTAGRYVFKPTGDPAMDARIIEYYLNNNKKKTMVFTEGTTTEVSQVLDIGSNTTIVASGAAVVQTVDGKGVLQHAIKGNKYNAIQNVKIVGGTWKNKKNTKAHSIMRFAHGKNIQLEGVTVETNFQSHGVALVACKNAVVNECTIVARNNKTKKSNSVEEALQIDLATPLTAPGVYQETGKKSYVNGQTSQNIKVTNSTIYGSRGICANFAAKEKRFHNKFHRNITITGCTITGTSSEALALLNTMGATVKNNTIKTLSKRSNSYSDGIHFVLIGKTKAAKKYKNVFTGNTVYGKYYGIDITSKNGTKHGTVTVQNNTVYCKKGKKRCLHIVHCKKIRKAKNRCKKW